nr:hypothetical protein [Tanacetum cinerariifolium]
MQQIQDKAKESCMVSFRQLHSHLKLLSNNDLKGTRTECGFKRAFATLFGQDLETFTGTIPIYDEEPMAEVQTTAEINVFATEQQHIEQPEFNNEGEVDQNAEQCHDTFTTHYLPRDKGSAFAKPHHMITHGSSRNSEPSVMPSAKSQSTANDSKPKPRINHQNSRNWPASKSSYVMTKTVPIAEHPRNSRNFFDSKHFVCLICQKCVFNENHDSCVTKFLKEVNSRAKVPSNKTTNINKPVEQTTFAKKPERQIPKGHRFSIKKTSVVHEKTITPRSCLRWKPMGKIFKTVGLRWVPTGKIFTSSTTKVDSDPINGSNKDITNQYECKQTLDVSAVMTSDHNSSELRIHDHNNEPPSSKLVPKVVPPAYKTATSQ